METKSQLTVSQFAVSSPVAWLPVGAIAVAYGAIALSWVIYRIHLPTLTQQVGFAPDFAPKLLLLEAILAIALEPLAGHWSDRLVQRRGSRFPLISLGAIAASALFMAIPAFAIWRSPDGRWLLAALLILWSVAVNAFRAPVLALLGQYAQASVLPLAAGVLTVTTGLAGAVLPLGKSTVLAWGAPFCLALMAGLVLGTVALLRAISQPTLTLLTPHYRPAPRSSLAIIFGMGCLTTLALRWAIAVIPNALKFHAASLSPGLGIGLIFLTMAISALVTGLWAVRLDNRKAMVLGAAAMAACLLLLVQGWLPTVASIGLGLSYSLLANGVFALALAVVPPSQFGLAAGLALGGAAAAASLDGLGLATWVGGGAQGALLALLGVGLLAVASPVARSRAAEPLTR